MMTHTPDPTPESRAGTGGPATGEQPPPSPDGAPVVLIFTEAEYLYGMGTVCLRVDRIAILRSQPGWALIGGVRIDHLGVDRERRDISVSMATLRTHLPV